MEHDTTTLLGSGSSFQTTAWNLVRAIRDPEILNSLLTVYWKPLYFFVRQKGYDNETAKDIVQAFLATLLERDALSKADPARGRFRTYLLAALTNYLKDWTKAHGRQKRGAGANPLSLDFARGEEDYRLQVARGESPESALNRAWARGLWEMALSKLEAEAAHRDAFRLWLASSDYKTICKRTRLSEPAAKSAVHRMRLQVREIVTAHLRRTVGDDEALRDEVAQFLAHLSRP